MSLFEFIFFVYCLLLLLLFMFIVYYYYYLYLLFILRCTYGACRLHLDKQTRERHQQHLLWVYSVPK